MNHRLIPLLLITLVLVADLCSSTPPLKPSNNKFTSRTVQDIENTVFKDHLRHPSRCGHQPHLGWTAHTGSVGGIHAHPIVRPAYLSTLTMGGTPDATPSSNAVCVASLSGTVAAFNTDDGSPLPGWPLSSAAAASHAAPVLIDTDGDGREEMILATSSGQIVLVASDGSYVTPIMQLPPVKVRRDWHSGMDPEDTDIVQQMPHYDTPHTHADQDGQKNNGNGEKSQNHRTDAENNGKPGARRLHQMHTTEGWLSPEAKEAMTLLGTVSADGDGHDADAKTTHWKRWPEGYVLVDPHVLATPIKMDVNGDGRDDLVIAVSYYFETEEYNDPVKMNKLPPDVDPKNYVASSVVAISFSSSSPSSASILWSTTLDLTTAHLEHGRADIHASPVSADITGTGHPDIVVATGVGFLYVLDRHGNPVSPFPVQMASLQSTPLVADVNEDGSLDICAADIKSNLACFTSDGEELWERQITSFNAAGIAAGDIDGDGALDLAVPAGDGRVYVVRGKDGDVLPGFPVALGSAVYSPPALVSMPTSSSSDATPRPGQPLTIVAAASDGHLFLIDGKSGCVDKVDIGENVFGGLQVADLDDDGRIDILLATMHGSVVMLHTDVPDHPLRRWHPLQQQSLEGAGSLAVYIPSSTRHRGDVVGPHFAIEFQIVDERRLGKSAPPRQYHITISLSSGLVLHDHTYSEPGSYTVKLDAPTQRMTSTITVRMVNEHGAMTEDSFQLSFNMYFWRILKWLVVLPFLMSFGVVLLKNQRDKLSKEP